jgi:hypothetical protein
MEKASDNPVTTPQHYTDAEALRLYAHWMGRSENTVTMGGLESKSLDLSDEKRLEPFVIEPMAGVHQQDSVTQ